MADAAEFRRTLDQSLVHLGTYLDLFGFHGINRPEHLEWITRPGGCLEVVREYQQEGKIKFIGFSTHAPTPVIVKAIKTGIFDYINLHFHAIGSYTSSGTSESLTEGPGNWEGIQAAHRQDMGVFIISAADKGGMLYRPPKALVRLCSPLSPLIYNMLWLWNLSASTTNPSSSSYVDTSPSSLPAVHTLVIGAARPSDFDEAAAAAKLFLEMKAEDPSAPLLRRVDKRMQKAYREVWGEAWEDDWWVELPDCYQNPFGVHVAQIVWMWSITKVRGGGREGGRVGWFGAGNVMGGYLLPVSFSSLSSFSHTHPPSSPPFSPPCTPRPTGCTATRPCNTPKWKAKSRPGRRTSTSPSPSGWLPSLIGLLVCPTTLQGPT